VASLSQWWCSTGSFPNSADPVAEVVPIEGLGSLCGTAVVLCEVPLHSFGQIAYGQFLGSPCAENWRHVVVRLDAAVQGVQFDRYGALWVGGVEVLRTTSAEPTPAGVRWQVRRDLTEYAALFRRPQNVSLSIPNTVTDTYNGVIFANVSFEFYAGQPLRGGEGRTLEVQVLPLLDVAAILEKPWSVMAVAGNTWQNSTLPPLALQTERLFLDVFASGHGCEEFEAGFDCGAPLRRLRALIDGHPAGVMYPFPVLYTGGVNPLLWRPLTGLGSWDVAPYRFELTAFLPLLLAKPGLRLSLAVDHSTEQGLWYLDPVLVAYHGAESASGGEFLGSQLSGGYVEQGSPGNGTMKAEDHSTFSSHGILRYPGGREVQTEVRGALHATSRYRTFGGGGGPTMPPNGRRVRGRSRGSVVVSRKDSQRPDDNCTQTASFDFPYRVVLDQWMNSSSPALDINASVWQKLSVSSSGAAQEVSQDGRSRFVRDDARQIVLGSSFSESQTKLEVREASESASPCYRQSRHAANGSMLLDTSSPWHCKQMAAHSLLRALPSLGPWSDSGEEGTWAGEVPMAKFHVVVVVVVAVVVVVVVVLCCYYRGAPLSADPSEHRFLLPCAAPLSADSYRGAVAAPQPADPERGQEHEVCY
ncbi:unnamed protein product, partial [Polarella glacialis]